MQMVRMQKIKKSFGKTQALKNADFTIEQGEILSLLGENGAGKTTLMKVLYGMIQPDEGEIFFKEKRVEIRSPIDAIKMGICMVHQHFMLIPAFSVTDNIIAGVEPTKGIFIDRKKAHDQVKNLIEKFNFNLNPDALVETLSVGEQQRVEILKALYRDAKVLILDEPTAVLTPSEVTNLFETLDMLRKQGTSIVIITHKLYETMSLADRVAVLRDGEMIRYDVRPAETNVVALSEMMVGRQIKLDIKYPAKKIGEPYLRVKNLTFFDERGVEKLKDISFEIKAGEIYGIAGVEGNGQSQLLEALTGISKPKSMKLELAGKELTGDAHYFIHNKVGHVPEDRSSMGLIAPLSIRENLILGYHDFPDMQKHGIVNREYVKEYAEKSIKDFMIKTPDMELPVRSLSGGNQQKVVMARVLNRDLDLLVVAHPTRGIDIGSSEYMHEQIRNFRNKGKAVLLISADLDEVYTLSDRLAVLYDGNIVTECVPEEFTKVQLGLLMTGTPLETVLEVSKNEGSDK